MFVFSEHCSTGKLTVLILNFAAQLSGEPDAPKPHSLFTPTTYATALEITRFEYLVPVYILWIVLYLIPHPR